MGVGGGGSVSSGSCGGRALSLPPGLNSPCNDMATEGLQARSLRACGSKFFWVQGVLSTLAGCWDPGLGQSQLLDDAEGSGSQGQSRPDAEPAPHLCQEQRRDLVRGLCSWGLSWGDHLLSPHGDLGKVAIQVSLVPVSLPLPLPLVVRSPGALRPGL